MIRNIVFDIGNVLTDFRWREFLADLGFEGAMAERIAAAAFQNRVYSEIDRGVWSDEELLAAFVAEDPGIEKELRRTFENIHGMVTLRDYAVSWVRELKKKGYGVWYLSNFSKKAEAECADALAFLPDMDGGILSYREKLIKPDPAIYRLLLDRYGLKAEECVFVDDTPVNVEAAVREGFRGIVFRSRQQVIEEMRGMGIDA